MACALYNPWRVLGKWVAILFWIYILWLLMGCSMTPRTRGELFDQRVTFVSSYDKGPVNKQCDEYSGTTCKKWNVVEYDLTDVAVREEFFRLKFVCNVAGERYIIAKSFPGVERFTYKNNIFSKSLVRVDYFYLPHDHKKLVNSQAWCAAIESINGKMMFLR